MEIEVALPVNLDAVYSYSHPENLPVGSRVVVPFRTGRLLGVVVGCKQDGTLASLTPEKKIRLKKIIETYDSKVPYFDEATMALARWMSDYYIYPLGEVLKTMRPLSHKKTARKVYGFNPEADFSKLREIEREVAETFWKTYGLDARVDRKTFRSFVKDLALETSLEEIEKFSSYILANVYCLSQETLAQQTVSRLSEGEVRSLNSKRQSLTESQHNAVTSILEEFQEPPVRRRPLLLHGVTGAGKTEVYLHLLASILQDSDARNEPTQILFLVPEISLTPQMTGIFKDRLADRVAVVHSAMEEKQRLSELEKIRSGYARVLIGPRSALFADFCNLGLILIDEEHDSSYKQTNNLCYHARDVAIVLAKVKKIPIVLGSATPSLESMKNAKDGRYKLVEMPERILGRPLPPVKLVRSETNHKSAFHLKHNLNSAGVSGDRPNIDKEILTALSETHERREQAMILVNRRGFSHYLFSLEKKKAVQCPFCSISLTMHLYSVELQCHYCDYRVSASKYIADHPEESFLAVGYGSERVEDFLKKEFPTANVVRVDSDTASERGSLEQILSDFRTQKIDFLVGTQILAKGHDFSKVSLVVIIDLDHMLEFPDFRAAERTFQLLVQAGGRAGRGELEGRVLVQAKQVDHPVILDALKHNYQDFYDREIRFRQECFYPPFTKLILFEISSESQDHLHKMDAVIYALLEDLALREPDLIAKIRIMGPSKPAMEKVRQRFRRNLLLNSKDIPTLHRVARTLLSGIKPLMTGDLRVRVDVDPQSLM